MSNINYKAIFEAMLDATPTNSFNIDHYLIIGYLPEVAKEYVQDGFDRHVSFFRLLLS